MNIVADIVAGVALGISVAAAVTAFSAWRACKRKGQ